MAASKIRIDLLLVERGLAESGEKAKALLLAGRVRGEQGQLLKPGMTVNPDFVLRMETPRPFVSRGGDKLDKALKDFALDCRAFVCLDVGASTGGFTDCLLKAGARKVYAIDVGKAQLHQSLLNDSRVEVYDEVNARFLEPGFLPEKVDLIVMDVSFISVTMILPRLTAFLKPEGEVLTLVKPQFEAVKEKVEKGGIVKDKSARLEALEKVVNCGMELGLRFRGVTAAPILPRKNREFLIRFSREGESLPNWPERLQKAVEDGD